MMMMMATMDIVGTHIRNKIEHRKVISKSSQVNPLASDKFQI